MYNIFYFYFIHTGVKLGTKQLDTFGFNRELKKKNHHRTFHLKKITVTSTKIDSSHESGKNFITWTWPASTTIIYNNHVSCKRKGKGLILYIQGVSKWLGINFRLNSLRKMWLKT
jgi:hypothetical protein